MPPGGRTPRLLVWARAVILGSVVMLVGSVAHVSAGGLLPGPAMLAGMLAAGIVASAGFLERPASTIKLALLVIGGQSLVHLGLSLTAGHRPSTTSPLVEPAGHGSHAHTHLAPESTEHDEGVTGALSHLVQHLLDQGPLMLLAHLAAAAAVGAWLAVGERALWALLALSWARLGYLVRSCRRALAWWAGAGSAPSGLRQAAYASSAGFLPAYRLAHRATATRGPPALRLA